MFSAEERKERIRWGEHLLREGRLSGGLEFFKNAGVEPSKDLLIECANECLYKDQGKDAFGAFRLAGVEFPKDKLIALSEKWLKEEKLYNVIAALETAGAKDKLIALAKKWRKEGRWIFVEAFEAAGTGVPKEEFVAYGKQHLKYARKGYMTESVLKAFKAAGAKEELVAYGDECLRKGMLSYASEAFEAAGVKYTKEELEERRREIERLATSGKLRQLKKLIKRLWG